MEIGAVGAPPQRGELVVEPLVHDEVLLVCNPAHPWAQRDSVTLKELAAEPQVVQQQGAGIRAVVEDHLRRAGYPPERLNIVMEMGLMESAKQACIAGGGVTFVSRWAVGPELEHGLLAQVAVDGFVIHRDFYYVYSRNRVLSRAADALLAYFREQYAASLSRRGLRAVARGAPAAAWRMARGAHGTHPYGDRVDSDK